MHALENLDGFTYVHVVEAILFASAAPVSRADLRSRLPNDVDLSVILGTLERDYRNRGVNLVEINDSFAFRTAQVLQPYMRQEVTQRRKLSRAAIETLAIVAYHQPCTRAEIEDIRGVGVSKGTLDLLIELDWVRIGRRRETPGRPVTFQTTDVFLDHFGLSSNRDLPSISELRAAGLLDADSAQFKDVMRETDVE